MKKKVEAEGQPSMLTVSICEGGATEAGRHQFLLHFSPGMKKDRDGLWLPWQKSRKAYLQVKVPEFSMQRPLHLIPDGQEAKVSGKAACAQEVGLVQRPRDLSTQPCRASALPAAGKVPVPANGLPVQVSGDGRCSSCRLTKAQDITPWDALNKTEELLDSRFSGLQF